jgi:hypothetical protein
MAMDAGLSLSQFQSETVSLAPAHFISCRHRSHAVTNRGAACEPACESRANLSESRRKCHVCRRLMLEPRMRHQINNLAPSRWLMLAGVARANGAGDGNRTHVSSLGSYSSTIELHPRGALILCGIQTTRQPGQPRGGRSPRPGRGTTASATPGLLESPCRASRDGARCARRVACQRMTDASTC